MPKTIRPGDLLRPPLESSGDDGSGGSKGNDESDDDKLPDQWKTAIQDARKWPFVDPDVMLKEETDSYGDFPTDIDNLPKAIPFSEFEPWGKMEEETNRDYELFSHYRASGLSRTYAGTARSFEISQPYVSKVANRHDWPDRVRAWDEYRERIYTTTVIEKTKKMAEGHADVAAKGIRALALVFDEIIQRGEEDPELMRKEMEELSFRGLFTLADKAARALPNLMNAERLSRGLPTELTADIQIKENRVVVQTTEEISKVVVGLFDALSKAGEEGDGPMGLLGLKGEEKEDEEEIVDAEVIGEEE